MRRIRGSEIILTSGDAKALLALAHRPFDLDRAPVSVPGPAAMSIAALGHLVRAYLDPLARVREAALEIVVDELRVRGDEDVLDQTRMLLPEHRDTDDAGPFRWAIHLAEPADNEQVEPVVGWLDHLLGPALVELIARDSSSRGLGLLAAHEVAIARSVANLVASVLPEGAIVDARISLTIFGATFDRGLPGHEHLRSQIEAPASPSFLRRIRGSRRSGGG